MSLDQLRSLRTDPARSRTAELLAVAHAVRPVAADFASTLFFYSMLILGADARAATAAGIAVGLSQVLYMWLRRLPLSPMQVGSIVLVALVGCITLLTNDARIMFWKVSAIYAVVGCTMLRPGWMQRHVPPIAVEHLQANALAPWEFAWASLILSTGALNLGLSLTQPVRTTAVVFGIVAPTTKLVLFALQYAVLRGRARRSMKALLEAAIRPT